MGEGKMGEEHIIRGENLNYTPDTKGLGYVLYHAMKNNKDAIAQIDASTDQQDSYSSLLQRCVRTALVMRSRGLTSKDIVAMCSNNHLNSCVPYIASLFLGIKVCCYDPTITPFHTVHLLKLVRPKIIFVIAEVAEMIGKAAREAGVDVEIVVFENNSGVQPDMCQEFSEFLVEQGEEEGKFAPVEIGDVKETAAILFSSGTTGLQKGVCLGHDALLTSNAIIGKVGPPIRSILFLASLYWVSSVNILICAILNRRIRIFVDRFEPVKLWQVFDKYKVSIALLNPYASVALMKAERPKQLDLNSLASIIIGGGPLSAEQVTCMRAMVPDTCLVTLVYGLTETSGTATTFGTGPTTKLLAINKPSSSGRAVPGFAYKVVDTETEEALGPNKKGEIRLKGPTLMKGYYNLNNLDVFDSDGFLKTGDIGYYDEDGCFYVTDRIKELLKFQSLHVEPAAIEAVLLTHPEVAEGIVVGIPHEMDGDHAMAVVVPKRSCRNVSPDAIRDYVDTRVGDKEKLRAGVKFIDKIPYTASGKPRRKEVRDMILSGGI